MLPMTLARIIVSVALFCAPFILYVVFSNQSQAGMMLLFPLFGAIPAIVAALILFLPIELLLENKNSWLKNILIPLTGASVIFIFMFIMARSSYDASRIQNLAVPRYSMEWGIYAIWSVAGATWGVIWRFTEFLAKWTGLANG